MEIVYLIIGLILGGVISFFITKAKARNAESLLQQDLMNARAASESLQTMQRSKEEEIIRIRKLSEEQQERIISLNAENARLDSEQKAVTQRLLEQKEEIENLREKFNKEFRLIANELLDEKSKKFTETNKENIDGILKPLREKLLEFEQKVDVTHKDSIQFNAALRQQITGLMELNQQMSKEANNLTRALKGDTKAQGNWGEVILESLLEKSGLTKDREYRVQVSLTNDEGRRLQPDVVVDLPDNKAVVVDAKVSLVAYERFITSEEEAEKTLRLKEHITSLRGHIRGLSDKNYQQLYQLNSLDFVLLFIPVEPAFSLALQYDNQLFNDALDRNIVIVSPSTLLATLRTISSIWKQEYQNKNVMEIAKLGGDMYDKFEGFAKDLIDVGKRIEDSKKSYEGAMNKLVDGRGNLVRQAERLKQLGAKASKSLPENLVLRAFEGEEE
jgi:DNA recombination protein RmuC